MQGVNKGYFKFLGLNRKITPKHSGLQLGIRETMPEQSTKHVKSVNSMGNIMV